MKVTIKIEDDKKSLVTIKMKADNECRINDFLIGIESLTETLAHKLTAAAIHQGAKKDDYSITAEVKFSEVDVTNTINS